MKIFDSFRFWKHFDYLLDEKNENINKFSERAGLNYRTVTTQRNRHTLPSVESIFLISQALGVSMEYLLTGESGNSNVSKEMAFVRDNPACNLLVKRLMEDEYLLDALGAVVRSYDHDREKKA